MDVVISAAVEGIVDEAVVRKLIEHAGGLPGEVYGKTGKANILERIHGYNSAARFRPWLVLIDLDRDADCAPTLRLDLLEEPSVYMCIRIAVRRWKRG